MKIFTGGIPEHPLYTRQEVLSIYREGQQSILNQCKEVDIDALQTEYEEYKHKWFTSGSWYDEDSEPITFTEFIQSQIQPEKKP